MTARRSEIVHRNGVTVETYIDGDGPPFVILPSYGRDGGKDYDNLTARLVQAGWRVLRPQPRGIAGSSGPLENQSMHDLAEDVALCIQARCQEPVVLLGHAFGNVLARVLTTDRPDLVRALVLAAAEASKVPEDVGKLPFIAGDLSASEDALATEKRVYRYYRHASIQSHFEGKSTCSIPRLCRQGEHRQTDRRYDQDCQLRPNGRNSAQVNAWISGF